MRNSQSACLSSAASSILRLFAEALASSPRIGVAILVAALSTAAMAQPAGRAANNDEFRALPNHVPAWANDANFVAPVEPEQAMAPMTMVLARHADRQAAFEKLLADQQDPSSPQFHKWLTPDQIGARFGLTDDELNSLKAWIESQGLHVSWVAPARNFIGFSGAAREVSQTFQADLNIYDVAGERRISPATPPLMPADLAPMVSSIRGLYTIQERPMHRAQAMQSISPDVTTGDGSHFIMPSDFTKIYDNANSYTGKGISIGLVGRSRTDFADFDQFRSKTGTTFANPTEIVPTKFGGADPGPAFTSPTSANTGDQGEAELDVTRSASIAQQAKVLLVVTTSQAGDIGADAQYLIQTTPVPVQVISISFGLCESHAGPSGVNFWDALFQQAAGEGISVFVSSGDSGASGCDPSFQPPPVPPLADSPNYICSSSYATCVGGTEFNDADAAKYWNSTNGTGYESALSYIPEGAWNEPQSGSDFVPASSGGGVSNYIATPSWQTGTGVPSARAGRYTPDVAFSASGHDGYFACFAAYPTGGADCVNNAQNQFGFLIFSGTSAAAPDMAGVAALLDQKLGKGQGNLNPQFYSLAKTAPTAFHDVTVASSGVSGCKVTTPSMCNNSVPGPTSLTTGQAGFLVTAGYDEATGLGSLDVNNFLAKFTVVSGGTAPTATTGAVSAITATGATLAGTVNPNGAATQYWFLYGTSSTLAGGIKSAAKSASGSTAVAITAKLTGLTPGTRYYFEVQASNATGPASGTIASFTTPKGSQTITFKQPASPVKYGAAPVALVATSSSGLPVKLTLVSGPGKLTGSTLTITGAGSIVVAANQAGNTSYLAAAKVTRTLVVNKALLTVTAKNATMTHGSPVPALAFTMTGWVNADNRGSATKGKPALSTTATSSSGAGTYPIKVSVGTVVAPNYTLKFVNGVMTVK